MAISPPDKTQFRQSSLPAGRPFNDLVDNRPSVAPGNPTWLLALLAELPTLDEDFGPIEDPTPAPIQV